jgi:hypothetical protein
MTHTEINELMKVLSEKQGDIGNLKAFIGFDGYIDEISRAVRRRDAFDDFELFQTIEEFSGYIGDSAQKSADIEILVQETKKGGNAPLMAEAVAKLGVETRCAGTMGRDEIHEVFKTLSANYTPISIGEPASTYAFEFNDGKLMFGKVSALDRINWENIKKTIGLAEFIEMFRESDIAGILNWSASNFLDTVLSGILTEVIPRLEKEVLDSKYLFFDISDPSKRNRNDLLRLFAFFSEYSRHTKVVLSLNEKEAGIICSALDDNFRRSDITDIAGCIADNLNVHIVAIHTPSCAAAALNGRLCLSDGFYVEKPRLSTGGGDNFNAGFCLGLVLRLPIEQSLLLGNAVSAYYVGNGFSPSLKQLQAFLKSKPGANVKKEEP